MTTWNYLKKELYVKIVYYGPGLCGKTTNIEALHARLPERQRGEKKSLNTEADRTLFFDYLPMNVGTVNGFKTTIQIFTVPGQVFYNQTRKLVLKGADGVVFVADSQPMVMEENHESVANLRENLLETEGIVLESLPLVYQWNKRDLPGVLSVAEMEAELNPLKLASFESVAINGVGVFETLQEVVRQAILEIRGQAGEHSGSYPVINPDIDL